MFAIPWLLSRKLFVAGYKCLPLGAESLRTSCCQLPRSDWVVIISVTAAVIVGFQASDATAAEILSVDVHKLDCAVEFPCPDELQRRVDFWVEVYSKWPSDQAILHDSRYPERVFEVVKSPRGCGRSKLPVVKKALARTKATLNKVADALASGKKLASDKEKRYRALYPDSGAKGVRSAIHRVRCQEGNRDRFEHALKRYGSYKDMVLKILKDAKLSSEIHYLPFVESLYNPGAYSRIGAAGLWQIMPHTARSLGLELNATLDERMDPEAATRAAAKYLKDAKRRLSKLAKEKYPGTKSEALNPYMITSYNYGVSGMMRALSRVGPDYVEVINKHKSPIFQIAVKNFYASFLAARYVARNAQKYFGKVKTKNPIEYDTVVLNRATSLQRIKEVFDLDTDTLKPLNAALTRYVWHEWRFVPEGYRLRLPTRNDGWKKQLATLEALQSEAEKLANLTYRVKRGDTACGIARAFRINCRSLIRANGLGKRALIRVDQKLAIPGKAIAKTSTSKATKADKSGFEKLLDENGRYRVRKGDTACQIAERFNIRCKSLIAQNKLGRRATVYVGQRLILPGVGLANRERQATKTNAEKPNNTERTVVALAESAPENIHVVKHGESPCSISNRLKVNCAEFLRANNLTKHSVIQPGQKLKIPSAPDSQPVARVEIAQTSEKPSAKAEGQQSVTTVKQPDVVGLEGVQPAGENVQLYAPLDMPLALNVSSSNDKQQNFIYVEPEETLGHYADWLSLRSPGVIQDLNKISAKNPIIVGNKLLLPIEKESDIVIFERKRQEYHRVLVEEFKENFEILAMEVYRVKKGDSAWSLAQEFELPVWLITRFNEQLTIRAPFVGEKLAIPTIQAKDIDG